MRNCSIAFLVTLWLTAAGTACSGYPTSPSDPSLATATYMAAQLEGTWAVASIQPAGQPKQDRPTGATYTLTFADGRLSTRADCNICSGAFSLNNSMMTTVGVLACTRAACATATFETAYTQLLGGESTTAMTGNTLTLSSSRGVLIFTR